MTLCPAPCAGHSVQLTMADEYISPFKEERDHIDDHEGHTNIDGLLNAKEVPLTNPNEDIVYKGDQKVKLVKELAKSAYSTNKHPYRKQTKQKAITLMKFEDTLLTNLLNASPEGSPIKTDLITLQFVDYFKDIDPLIFPLTSPLRTSTKERGDYHLAIYELAYIQALNRYQHEYYANKKTEEEDKDEPDFFEVLNEGSPISWRIPKGRAKFQKIKRTVVTPDFHPSLKVDELNEDLSKFVYPKVEKVEQKLQGIGWLQGWSPDPDRAEWLNHQMDWLRDTGSDEERNRFDADLKRASIQIDKYKERTPIWIKIAQLAEELYAISLKLETPVRPTVKAITDYLMAHDEIVNEEISKFGDEKGNGKKSPKENKWYQEFKIARQFIFISQGVSSTAY